MRMGMKKTMKTGLIGVLFSLLGWVLGTPAAYAITLEFIPSSQIVNNGGTLTTNIVVSGLETGFNEIVSAFDFSVTYDAILLAANPVVFGTDLSSTDPFFSFQDFDVSFPGKILLSELAFTSDADLQAFQGNSVTLATLSFSALGVGTSALDFAFPNIVGLNFTSLPLTINAGSVQVNSGNITTTLPEPSTLLLLGSGLAGLAMGHYRKKHKAYQ